MKDNFISGNVSNTLAVNYIPKYITIGTHYKCNARCIFCLGGNYPRFSLDIYKSFFEKRLGRILKKAEHVGFCGFGEIFLYPNFVEFLEYISQTLPTNKKVFTTNAVYFNNKIFEQFYFGKWEILVSINSSNEFLYKKLFNKQYYRKVIENIKKLIEIKKSNKNLYIALKFLIMKENIDDLPNFIKLAIELGVDAVHCSYLTIYDINHLYLTCFFEKEKVKKVFDEVEKIKKNFFPNIFLPPVFGNNYVKKEHEILCLDPWEFFYVEVQGSVNPCCFAGNHIGYLNKQNFDEIWNGEGYRKLREGLINNNPHLWCKNCYKYDHKNVDKILSHVTFRPETQKMIVKYLKEHRDEFKLSEEDLEL